MNTSVSLFEMVSVKEKIILADSYKDLSGRVTKEIRDGSEPIVGASVIVLERT